MPEIFYWCLALHLALSQLLVPAAGEAVQVDSINVRDIIQSNELVLLLFYSNACRFSVQMLPLFDAAADQLRSLIVDSGQVTLGKVDCLKEVQMEINFDIGKYPTVKIVRHTHVSRKEYRGKRSTEALMQFVLKELQNPIEEFGSLHELNAVVSQNYMVIGYFARKQHAEYEIYQKAAYNMKEHCQFHVNFAETHLHNMLTFRRELSHTDSHSVYSGNMSDFTAVLSWFKEMCVPTVRVLTFENAEELSEEGKPFVILFHHKDDRISPTEFEKVIQADLMDELDNVIFLTADAKLFAHPVYHLNKTDADLPFIAIDSFVHMFVFPNYKDLHKPAKLKQFVRRLHTGELHWAHHFDEANEESTISSADEPEIVITMAPESKFKELLPSKSRYTFAKDEL
ncbi:endoplasmic reticulum resident protein 44 [Drosophila montana]|uniref:endoplasmic reticulum resident protein 44 n=1 Tax=Drosophila montana TaxID=40370 RepID=UPI00313DF33B